MSAKPDKTPPPQAPGVHPKPGWSFRPVSDRQAGDAVVSNFLLHWFPAKSFKASLSWGYSFWLGTVSAALLFAGGDQGGSQGQGLTYASPIGPVYEALDLVLAT